MKKNEIISPVYAQIALDIALRIARGDLKENTKVYGRSVMASEYGVSPETIRRSMKLLEDMKIVETKQNSGTVILSAENAKNYVEKFDKHNNIRIIQKKLKGLIGQQETINRQIVEVAESIVRINERFSMSNPFTNYEIDIPSSSVLIGHSLGELKFWQRTGATVIAIRRNDKLILSPGPYLVLYSDDTIIFVGDVSSIETVNGLIHQETIEFI